MTLAIDCSTLLFSESYPILHQRPHRTKKTSTNRNPLQSRMQLGEGTYMRCKRLSIRIAYIPECCSGLKAQVRFGERRNDVAYDGEEFLLRGAVVRGLSGEP